MCIYVLYVHAGVVRMVGIACVPDVGSSRNRMFGTLKSCTATASLLRCENEREGEGRGQETRGEGRGET